jgi:solute carrier family 32 (vesicular inhibitory amino acid transporter)
MAFLGAFSAFLICILGPIGAKVAIERRCSAVDAILLAIVFVMMVWGTLASFMVQEI